MAIVEIELVRSKFEPGDSPKGSDYLDLIDSLAALPDISGKQDVVANVSSTEIGYLDGVTSAIQTQINTKAPTDSPTFTGTVTIPSGSAITGVPYLATANTFTGGVQQITTASAATVGLIVKASASQTANLQQWQDSGGGVLTRIQDNGSLSWGTGSSVLQNTSGTLTVNPSSTSAVSVTVKGAASQTADLQQWQTSAGQTNLSVNFGGALQSYIQATADNINSGITSFIAKTSYANVKPMIVQGAASQTADLQQWQNSAGTVLSRVASNGVIKANVGLVAESNTSGNYTALQVNSYVASGVGIIIVGAASQTASLMEWQNSAGNVLSFIGTLGQFGTSATVRGTTGGTFGGNTQLSSAGLTVYATAAGNPGAIVRGAASQTANLQEWQNSAGTVLANVDQTGYMWSPTQDVAAQGSWTGAVTLSQTDSLKTYIKKQLTGNTTVTVSDGVAGKTYSCTLELQQDATGSRSIILKGCRTAYGVALVLTTTASATDIVRLEWNGTYWTAFMGAAQISVPSSWV